MRERKRGRERTRDWIKCIGKHQSSNRIGSAIVLLRGSEANAEFGPKVSEWWFLHSLYLAQLSTTISFFSAIMFCCVSGVPVFLFILSLAALAFAIVVVYVGVQCCV